MAIRVKVSRQRGVWGALLVASVVSLVRDLRTLMVFLWLVKIVGESRVQRRVVTIGGHGGCLPGRLRMKRESVVKVDSSLLDVDCIITLSS